MKKFLDYLNEEGELQGGLHSKNPVKARKAGESSEQKCVTKSQPVMQKD